MFSSQILNAHWLLQLLHLLRSCAHLQKEPNFSILTKHLKLISEWNEFKSGSYFSGWDSRALLNTNKGEHDGHCNCNTECLHLRTVQTVQSSRLLQTFRCLRQLFEWFPLCDGWVCKTCWYLYSLRPLLLHHWQHWHGSRNGLASLPGWCWEWLEESPEEWDVP